MISSDLSLCLGLCISVSLHICLCFWLCCYISVCMSFGRYVPCSLYLFFSPLILCLSACQCVGLHPAPVCLPACVVLLLYLCICVCIHVCCVCVFVGRLLYLCVCRSVVASFSSTRMSACIVNHIGMAHCISPPLLWRIGR